MESVASFMFLLLLLITVITNIEFNVMFRLLFQRHHMLAQSACSGGHSESFAHELANEGFFYATAHKGLPFTERP